MIVKEMIKKEIDKLPENLATEVYDFIIFLETRREKELLTKTAQSLSVPSFEKVWNNEEDAVYDNL